MKSTLMNKLLLKFSEPTVYTLYFVYACFYLPRKADSIVKTALLQQGFTVEDVALSDTLYLLSYTVSIMFTGTLTAKYRSEHLLSLALIGLSVISAIKSFELSPSAYIMCQVFHAILQSVGWPTCIKVMSSYATTDRGLIMGVWTTCQSVGGVLGALLASFLLNKLSFSFSYLGHIPFLLITSVLTIKNVREYQGSPMDKKLDEKTDLEKLRQDSFKEENDVSIWKLFTFPRIVLTGIAYFFLKFLRYALLMWLPYYFEQGLNYTSETAGYMSTSFEIGGMIGTPFIGYFSDKYLHGNVAKASIQFLLASAALLILCNLTATFGVSTNFFFMLLIGVAVIGPDSTLSGTIIHELVEVSRLPAGSVGVVAGMIQSMGSSGSILQSGVVAFVSTHYSWGSLFGLFTFSALASAAILHQSLKGQK
eukprot:maker-scaffold_1-snap-gene-5.40-mRNA-1 protein AED:0.01 eAED:0.01 QI:135/1/1/1/1/1/3/268/421